MNSFSLKKVKSIFCLFVIFFIRCVLAESVIETVQVADALSHLPVKSYLVMDAYSGQIITASSNAHIPLAPASLTKLMTLYLVAKALKTNKISMTDMVEISQKASNMRGSRMFLAPYTRVAIKDLIQGIAVQSGNDASLAIAEYLEGTETAFVALMNQTATLLGMTGTSFQNASGLPAFNHVATVSDIALLVRTLWLEFPQYYTWYSQKSFTYSHIQQYNRNRLLWLDKSVDGVKTGETEAAGYCLAASAERDNRRLIVVVMGAPSSKARFETAQKLLDYGFRDFETHKVYSADLEIQKARLWCGNVSKVALGVAHDVYVTIPKHESLPPQCHIKIQKPLIAPLKKNTPVGEVHIYLRERYLVSAPLVVLSPVMKGSVWKQRLHNLVLRCVRYID